MLGFSSTVLPAPPPYRLHREHKCFTILTAGDILAKDAAMTLNLEATSNTYCVCCAHLLLTLDVGIVVGTQHVPGHISSHHHTVRPHVTQCKTSCASITM